MNIKPKRKKAIERQEERERPRERETETYKIYIYIYADNFENYENQGSAFIVLIVSKGLIVFNFFGISKL